MQDKILNNRYKIIEEIGRGGMAIVYSARDTLLERRVALKMLRPEYSSDSEFKAKFHQEARAVAKLSHPNVVSIYDIVVEDEKIYLVMEIVEGETLKDIIKRRGRLSIAESLEIARQIAAALSVAHGNQIVHCDIKPHNIILNKEMEVKVTDFGIARAVTSSTVKVTETVVGSAHYFSPEQAKGGDIKAYSDIYSLGVVLYEMTTGELPFQGESPISVALKHIQQEPVAPKQINHDIPDIVNELILKAIAKDPAQRFQDAYQMRQAITSCLKNLKSTRLPNKQSKKQTEKFNPDETKVMKKEDFSFPRTKKLESNTRLDKESDKAKDNSAKSVDQESKSIKPPKSLPVSRPVELTNPGQHNSAKNSAKDDPENSQLAAGFKKLSYLVGGIIIFFLLAAGGIYLFFQEYTDVPIVEVPNIEGKSLSEAEAMAADLGINLKESSERIFSEEIAADHIISQQPEAGERIKQSRPLNITVSKGAKLIEIPNFVNQNLRQALLELENLSLKSGDIQYIFRLSVQPGMVINQIPAAGAEVQSGSEVTLFVSRGERDISVKMPDLTGLQQEEAFELIRQSGLTIGKVNVEESVRFLDGQVISQSVKPGEYLPRGIAVDFIISRGADNNGTDVHLNRISINVTGSKARQVKIVVSDRNGSDVVYNALHNPGDNIIRDIRSAGPTELKVYFDNQLIKSQKYGG